MSNKTLNLTEALYEYLLEVSLREHPVLRKLRDHTAELPDSNMQIAPEQGQFMQFLIKTTGAQSCLEIGVFTGYSTLSTALALGPTGRIIACDISKPWTDIARQYWKEAGVEGKIDLRLQPALATIDTLIDEGLSGSFDFAFMDADKENYLRYYEGCLTLLRAGGILAIDNVLWDGDVINTKIDDPDTEAIRALNRKLAGDYRVDLTMLPLADGLTLVRKR
jgi:predicted O-methyltransferase YrrM